MLSSLRACVQEAPAQQEVGGEGRQGMREWLGGGRCSCCLCACMKLIYKVPCIQCLVPLLMPACLVRSHATFCLPQPESAVPRHSTRAPLAPRSEQGQARKLCAPLAPTLAPAVSKIKHATYDPVHDAVTGAKEDVKRSEPVRGVRGARQRQQLVGVSALECLLHSRVCTCWGWLGYLMSLAWGLLLPAQE